MKLSVIVPVLNEIDQLPAFLRMLAGQQGLEFELIIVDGGSSDGSTSFVSENSAEYPGPLCLVESAPGRGRQLNTGAARAASDLLLFLHIDTVFNDALTLARAVDEYRTVIDNSPDRCVAAHFRLQFQRANQESAFGYYFWEAKARLDRPECTHGDQGFLMTRELFDKVGPFDVDVPIAEDTRLAERVRALGAWHLLSSSLCTSARRFENEGLQQRQTLNALIMNFAAIGWNDFFSQARDVYRQQSETGGLDLVPFFALIDRLNRQSSLLQRLTRWYRTGIYVRPNAWQLAFLKDIKRNFRNAVPVDDITLPALEFHDRWFELLTDNLFGRLVAMGGTWIWYRLTVWRYRTGKLHP